MKIRSHLTVAMAATAAWALLASGVAAAATARPTADQREVLASTAPLAAQDGMFGKLLPASPVQVSVFTGRDQAGLAAAARAVSDPASPDYQHYLTPAQVRSRYGATAAQQNQVTRWLRQSGLHVTHQDAFTISATGRAGQALSTMGQCGTAWALSCGPGYDMVSGIGSPGPAFFRSFGSHPK